MIRQYFLKDPNAIPKLFILIILYILLSGLHFQSKAPFEITLLTPQKWNLAKSSQTEIASDPSACQISDSFTPEIKYWEQDICRWSKEHSMDPDLIATIMQIESCGNPAAISATGVRGMFQVTGANLDGENPFDPNVSMAKGPGKVLKNELKAANGNITAAMAGYNGGAWARQWINGDISTSTFISRLRSHGSGYWRTSAKANAKVNEVKWYAEWANIFYESKKNETATLQKWLDMGGSHLCTKASAQLNLPDSGPVFAGAEAEKK